MQLIDAVFMIGQMDDDAVICAREPFRWGSEATIVKFTEDFRIPENTLAEGFVYFLEKEEVDQVLKGVAGKKASRETQVELVCYYATHDATPAWFEDLAEK